MSDDREQLAEGSLISHLLELRNRLLKAVIAVVVLFVPCAWYQSQLFTFVATPLLQKLTNGQKFIALNPISPFMAPLKLAFFAAIFLAMPFVLYQAWAFVAPGLYRHEKRFAVPLVVSSILLFYAGVAFAYGVVFPLMFGVLATLAPEGVVMMPDINEYLSFVLLLFFAFGIAFEVPIATFLLVFTGLVNVETLTKNRGYVILAIFIIAAFLTPPDAISQCAMAIPMYALYEGGILASRIFLKDKIAARKAQSQE
jgi:sec-independent protein translocase protein TatC